jgi:hypothetical protein
MGLRLENRLRSSDEPKRTAQRRSISGARLRRVSSACQHRRLRQRAR